MKVAPQTMKVMGMKRDCDCNCHIVLCYVMLCYVMLCYVMLCYVMLCYVMLCYAMLCYVMLGYVLFDVMVLLGIHVLKDVRKSSCYVICYAMIC